ncbi:hypothetical protein AB0D67_05610 [Streptosporangium sp. NPDC048047]|uniref:hypothetical protein n=1 Tax=Streptosporangium sp. NPDC048047 TaxID=3155748 RepID=UPI003446876F
MRMETGDRNRIRVSATDQHTSGTRFEDLGADFGDYMTELRNHLHGSSFPWPGETTVVASLYAEVMNGLLDRGAALGRDIGVAGEGQVTMAVNYAAAEGAGIAAVHRIGADAATARPVGAETGAVRQRGAETGGGAAGKGFAV